MVKRFLRIVSSLAKSVAPDPIAQGMRSEGIYVKV
jgi:hypothetical protein